MCYKDLEPRKVYEDKFDNRINFSKFKQIYNIVFNYLTHRHTAYKFNTNDAIQEFILQYPETYTDDTAINARSLLLEPRA